MLSEKAVSRAQQKFFGMVRAAHKGELKNPSQEVADVADNISVKDAKDIASTKHKKLPEKKDVKEGKFARFVRDHSKGKVRDWAVKREIASASKPGFKAEKGMSYKQWSDAANAARDRQKAKTDSQKAADKDRDGYVRTVDA